MRVFTFGNKKKRIVLVAALAIAATAIGVAIAAWTTGGSGSGQAKAGTAQNLTISVGTPSGSLYPGGTADVAATIHNPNPYSVHVSSVSLGTVTADLSGCAGTDVTVVSPQTAGWDVPASSNLDVDLAGAISMKTTAPDACQGAMFTVALTATGASS
jgi:hypothetical protein